MQAAIRFRLVLVALLVGMVVALSATTAYAATKHPNFGRDRTFEAGPGPVGIVAGKFDGNRKVDLVSANRFGDASSGDVSCLAGNGDGTFDAPEQQDLTVSAYAIELADFDGDGNLDVVLTDPDSSPPSVNVLLGNGDCTFDKVDTEESGGTGGFEPFDLAVADFDRYVCIFLNDGSGELTVTDTVGTGAGSNPTGIDAGNFDGDRDADLAVALSGTGEVTILENQSGGEDFDQGTTFDVSNEDTVPVALEVGRFNRGDALDIATGNADGELDDDFVGVALGRGNGNFNAPRFYSSGGDSPFSLALGNYNLQRGTDIAAANQFTNAPSDANRGNVGVLSNRGDGTFVGPDTFDTGDGPNDVTAGRFNGDDKVDLATANFGDDDPDTVDSVSVLLNKTRR